MNIYHATYLVPYLILLSGTRVPCVAGEYFWARLVPVPVPVPVYLVHWLCCVMLRDYTTGKTS